MQDIIQWCNDNNGFLTAILSAVGLFLSTIAIVVSIKTARLPFKKKIVISTTTNIWFGTNPISNKVNSGVQGISVNVVNFHKYLFSICTDYLLQGKYQQLYIYNQNFL